MLRLQAEKAAREMIMSEYRHHRYEDELTAIGTLFYLERSDFISMLNSEETDSLIFTYADVLGPTRIRAVKNSLICFIASLCRLAIEMGANAEFCFALSDFYINYLESVEKESDLTELFRLIALHYYDIVQNKNSQRYSRPIANALRYIDRNIYGRCLVLDVAKYVGLDRHYFSSLFAKQVGTSPAKYILLQKLDEGKRVLTYTNTTVTEVAESLGFYDVAHFSRRFKETYGYSPSCFM